MSTKPPAPVPEAKPRYTVIRDTREKAGHGWSFAASPSCAGTVVQKMDTGDYTLVGYEDVLTIDRKGSVSEFAGNLTQKRFERELERMASFKVAVVLLEFDFEEMARWPEGSGIPAAKRKYMKLNKHVLMARYWQVKLKYPHVDFQFAGVYGKDAVSSLFKRVIETYGQLRKASAA